MSAKGSTFKLSEEAKQKIRDARRKRKEEVGYINTPETRLRMSKTAAGRKASAATRAKMSASKKGRLPANFLEFLAKGHAAPKPKGEDHPCWKGDQVGYGALHVWIRHQLGTPSRCEHCGTTEAEKYEWSNISGEYKRDLSDWARLCVPCHRKIDHERGDGFIWNRGKEVQTNTGRTHIKKGQHISKATEFKPGLVPHNKYLEPRKCLKCRRKFQPEDAKRHFCSRRCYWDSLTGETPARLKKPPS